MYTEQQIKEFKEKAGKWDALDEKIGKLYVDEDDEQDGADLADIGELALEAFGYL